MANRGWVEADAVAASACRKSGPRASTRTRYRSTRCPGSVEASASVARLAVRRPAGRVDSGTGRRSIGHVRRDARSGAVVAARWPVDGRQSRTADRDAHRRWPQRPGPNTWNVRVASCRQACAARVLGRWQEQPSRRPATAETLFGCRPTATGQEWWRKAAEGRRWRPGHLPEASAVCGFHRRRLGRLDRRATRLRRLLLPWRLSISSGRTPKLHQPCHCPDVGQLHEPHRRTQSLLCTYSVGIHIHAVPRRG